MPHDEIPVTFAVTLIKVISASAIHHAAAQRALHTFVSLSLMRLTADVCGATRGDLSSKCCRCSAALSAGGPEDAADAHPLPLLRLRTPSRAAFELILTVTKVIASRRHNHRVTHCLPSLNILSLSLVWPELAIYPRTAPRGMIN